MGRPENAIATPLGALLRGLLAGGGGTAAMTAYQGLVQSGGDGADGDQPVSEHERWQQAPAPAQVAKRKCMTSPSCTA